MATEKDFALDRELLIRRFARAAATYDEVSVLAREVARRMDERLDYIRIAPKRILAVKQEPFECGKDPVMLPEGRFAIKFSTIAIFFIIFDIELMFVFPWTVVYRSLGLYGFVTMVVYLGILMLGLFYVWRKGGLQWE